MPELTGVDGLTARLHHALGWREGKRNATDQMSVVGRLCSESFFAPLTANFSSCRRSFRVNMRGTSSPGDKLTGDFGNEPDATAISDRGLFRLLVGNLSPGVFVLLQQNLPGPDSCTAAKEARGSHSFIR